MTSIIITLLIVFYRVPLINIIGDKGMGYYSTALVIYLLLMTCIAYGLPKAVSLLITEYRSKGKYGLLYKTVQSSMLFALLAGGVSAVTIFLFADFIAVYLMNAAYSSYAIRAFAPCLIFISVLGVLHGIYAATKKVHISKISHKIEEVFVALLSLTGAYFFTDFGEDISKIKGDLSLGSAYSAMGTALGLTAGVLIACLFSLVCFSDLRKKLESKAKAENAIVSETKRTLIRTLIVTMLPYVLTLILFHISSLSDYAVFNRIMSVQGHKESSYIILLGMLNGKYEFFISLPLLIVNWFAASKVPVLKKIVQDGNRRKIHIKIGQSLRYIMLFVIPSTALYIIYSTPLMNLLFTGTNDTPSVMLKTGAISIVFYSLAAISNAVLNALDDWAAVAKNAFMSLIVQIVALLLMMIVFQWGIIAVVVSRIVFSGALFIFNEHTLRERTGYVQEYKRTFMIPVVASLIMIVITFVVYIITGLFLSDEIAVIITVAVSIPVYIMALVFLGGITQREMYRLPGGKYLAPLCRKLHLIQ